jgi:hypothetical protein
LMRLKHMFVFRLYMSIFFVLKELPTYHWNEDDVGSEVCVYL